MKKKERKEVEENTEVIRAGETRNRMKLKRV